MNDTTVTKMHLVCPHCNATNRVPSDKLQAELNCGKCQAPLLTAHPDNLGEAAFNAQLSKSELPMVVDFWAPWCGPCRQLSPIVDEVAKDMAGKLEVFKCNVDENPEVPSKYMVRGIPTLMIFKDGKVVDTKVGSTPKAALVEWLKNNA